MPELPKVKLTEITLPVSGAVCKIGITYGDKIETQKVLMKGMKLSVKTGKVDYGDVDNSFLSEQTKVMMLRGLKEWDMTSNGEIAEINWENISILDPKDGAFLRDEIGKIALEEVDSEEKKGQRWRLMEREDVMNTQNI